jgi:hypothetical protein
MFSDTQKKHYYHSLWRWRALKINSNGVYVFCLAQCVSFVARYISLLRRAS